MVLCGEYRITPAPGTVHTNRKKNDWWEDTDTDADRKILTGGDEGWWGGLQIYIARVTHRVQLPHIPPVSAGYATGVLHREK